MSIFYWSQDSLLDKKLPVIAEFDLFRNLKNFFFFFLCMLQCYLKRRDVKFSLSAENFRSKFAF
jgi:hypothetical protein